jgi:two-component sensor histidine kinase
MNKYNSAARDSTAELVPRIAEIAESEKEISIERDQLNSDGQELLQEARENFEVSAMAKYGEKIKTASKLFLSIKMKKKIYF